METNSIKNSHGRYYSNGMADKNLYAQIHDTNTSSPFPLKQTDIALRINGKELVVINF